MSALRVEGAGRQPAILALVAAIHAGVFLAIAGGLLPRLIEAVPQPAVQVLRPPPPEPLRRVPPARPVPVDYTPAPEPLPVIEIPDVRGEPFRQDIVREPGSEAAGPALASSAGAETPPALRIRDRRLAALIDACYPAAARRRGEEGRGLARVVIGPQGQVADWSVLQGTGSPRLDSALDCVVRRLSFRPGLRNGIAVASEVQLPIEFRLQ